MQIEKSRGAGRREHFSDFLSQNRSENETIEGIAPITRMDPDLREALVLEMLVRRMERLETLQEKASSDKEQKTAPSPAWCTAPVSEQDDTAGVPQPDIRKAAETYRRIGEL